MTNDSFGYTNIQCPKCGLKLAPGATACPKDGTAIYGVVDVGQVLAEKYQIVSRIASGGMGVVFKAKQLGLNRFVAIKVLSSSQLTAVAVRRFQQEAQALATMRHENLTEVFDVGVTPGGQPYMAMEYVEGISLANLLKNLRILPLQKAVMVFLQICDGLTYVHSHGILHRDLKPSNIMLVGPQTEYPLAKMLDFGIARNMDRAPHERLTQTGEIFGSPAYMSPEQARGQETDKRSDIYALGCVMYEVLTGVCAFAGASFAEVLIKQATEEAPLLNAANHELKYPNALENIVEKALKKQPSERYQSAQELAADLKSFAERNRLQYQRTAPQSAQRPKWLVAGLILLASVGVGAAFYVDRLASKNSPLNKLTGVYPVNAGDPHATTTTPSEDDFVKSAEHQLSNGESIEICGDPLHPQKLDFHLLTERKDHYLKQFTAKNVSFTDADAQYLTRFPIQSLNLSNTKVTGKSFEAIGVLTSLEQLYLQGDNLQNASFALLSNLSDLTEFIAPGAHLSDTQVYELTAAHELRRLDLSNNERLSDSSVISVVDTNQPLFLLLLSGDAKLTNESAERITLIKTLKELDLSKTEIKDHGFETLAHMPKLVFLKVDGTGITDSGLQNFTSQTIRYLSIRNCQYVDTAGIQALQKNCPNCDIDCDANLRP